MFHHPPLTVCGVRAWWMGRWVALRQTTSPARLWRRQEYSHSTQLNTALRTHGNFYSLCARRRSPSPVLCLPQRESRCIQPCARLQSHTRRRSLHPKQASLAAVTLSGWLGCVTCHCQWRALRQRFALFLIGDCKRQRKRWRVFLEAVSWACSLSATLSTRTRPPARARPGDELTLCR